MMDAMSIAKAVVLAVVEGATEFIPVSSTGHQLLVVAGVAGLVGQSCETERRSH